MSAKDDDGNTIIAPLGAMMIGTPLRCKKCDTRYLAGVTVCKCEKEKI